MDTKEARFWKRVTATGFCWLWEGGLQKDGYGQLSWGKAGTLPAHRVAWELLMGPIPKGLQLDHLCEVRNCVNPDHLDPVTKRENARRMVERKGWTHGGKKYEPKPRDEWLKKPNVAEKDVCDNGHDLEEVGYYTYTTNGSTSAVCNGCKKLYRCRERHRTKGCTPKCPTQLFPREG